MKRFFITPIQVAAVSAFSQTLRRYTSLNHLAQAARAVLQNPQQINQMWNDLNKVDFNNVQEQSSWVCQCDEGLVSKLEHDFKQTLAQQVRCLFIGFYNSEYSGQFSLFMPQPEN